MKTLAKFVSIIIILFLSIGYTNALTRTHLKVGYLPILDHLTLFVSHAKDHCTFQQVDIELKMFKAWGEMVGALKAGVIDAAFILSPLALDLFNQGLDIKTILLAHRDGSAITVKTGTSINEAADLKNKAIAIPDRKATHTALLNHYLMSAGLSLKDVQTKVIAPSNMLKAMLLGKIDAFIVAEPFGTKAQHNGVGKILVLTKDIMKNHVECIVVIHQRVIKENPQAIQEWVDSLIRAGQWIDQDKLNNGSKEVAHLTSKTYYPHSEENIIRGLQNPSDRISFSDLNPVQKDFQAIVDISVQAGIIDKVNLETFIDDSFYRNHQK
ncbi:ABC nitrate/nitrite/cyanate family transporter, periplasmic ligand binding protein [Beggiatoa sp. PS]|nr:ABC nitrate/nitrite/cyanate family transporter, periplasmic ligand binding protein [Beggiatoa sp. PS]